MQKGHWVLVAKGLTRYEALKEVAKLHSLGKKARITKRSSIPMFQYSAWKWVRARK